MSEFKNILVATDFSDTSDRAFKTAASLAAQLGASLHVVHIVQIHPANMPESGNVNIKALEATEEKNAKENMDSYIASLDDSSKVTTTVVDGDPTTQINRLVKDKKADLVVMGTHGRTGLSRLIMGSVAESVMTSSAVPVICVRAN